MRDKRLDGRATSPAELTLIRVGHHIWRSMKRKEWPEHVAMSALRDVWDAKELIRVPLRADWLAFVEKSKKNLRRRGHEVE